MSTQALTRDLLPDPPAAPDLQAGGACRLPFWGVMRARGAEAGSFLHGQLSNDVSQLSASQARLGAYCNAQGRMLASLIYARHATPAPVNGAEGADQPDEIWLLCSADLLAATLKRLSMFVLRAKVKLSDASSELAVIGLSGATGAQALGESAPTVPWAKMDLGETIAMRLPGVDLDGTVVPRWLWVGPTAQAEALLARTTALDPTTWAWLDVRAGIAPVVAATSGQFVPQMLNYELVGGVDFRKGCYPGQEVVARSQYLGKLKRRAFLVSSPVAAEPAQEVFWSGDAGQPAGAVAWSSAAPDGGHLALVELKIGTVDSGSLHLGHANGPALRLHSLPYAIPSTLPNEVDGRTGPAA